MAIMSNQKGVSKGSTTLRDVEGRMEQVVAACDVPIQCFFSPGDDYYRKPCVGMWFHMAKECNEGIAIDMASSMYVGDAAGRPPAGPRKRDFSAGEWLVVELLQDWPSRPPRSSF